MLSVSVIIPALNEKENLDVLVPYLQQTEGIDEIIVAEAADTKIQFTTDHEKVKVISCPFNHRAKQMNLGARTATGDIFVFLHADVRPHPQSFTRIQECIQKGNGFGFFSYVFEPSGFLLAVNARFTKKDGFFAGGGDQIHFMHKNIFSNIGGYDENVFIMEDFAFTRKIRQHEVPYCILDLPAKVSSRKYRFHSYLRVNFTNLMAMIMFYGRIPNRYIYHWCRYMLRT